MSAISDKRWQFPMRGGLEESYMLEISLA